MSIVIEPLPEWLEGQSENISQTLHSLHIPRKLKGQRYLAYTIEQTLLDPDLTLSITKELYPMTAKKFGVTDVSVERAIRTAVQVCWDRGGRETLDKIAGYHLTERPTNSEFIDLVAAYIQRRY